MAAARSGDGPTPPTHRERSSSRNPSWTCCVTRRPLPPGHHRRSGLAWDLRDLTDERNRPVQKRLCFGRDPQPGPLECIDVAFSGENLEKCGRLCEANCCGRRRSALESMRGSPHCCHVSLIDRCANAVEKGGTLLGEQADDF